jgi:hypothetical protein
LIIPGPKPDLQNWHRLIAKFYETFRDDFPMCIPVATCFVVANFLDAKKTKDEFLEFADIVWDLEQSAQQQPLERNLEGAGEAIAAPRQRPCRTPSRAYLQPSARHYAGTAAHPGRSSCLRSLNAPRQAAIARECRQSRRREAQRSASRRPSPRKVGNPRRQLQQLHLRLDLSVAQSRIETLSVSHHISPWHTGNTVAKS